MNRVTLLAGVVACVAANATLATLGETESSIDNDRAKMTATAQRVVTRLYSVHTLSTPAGVQVRQYVSSSGTVFAVSWNGPFMPDLRQLLGVHFVTLKTEEARSPHAGHSQVHIVRPEVVIDSTGHMRSFHGSAYIPSAVPAGVTMAELH